MDMPPEPSSGYSLYQIIGFILIFIVIASIMSYSKNLFSFDFSSLFRNFMPFLSNVHEPTGEETAYQPAPVELKTVSSNDGKLEASAEMYWCLVGEDIAGRWCVQVPNESNCEKDRLYNSKNKCEKQ